MSRDVVSLLVGLCITLLVAVQGQGGSRSSSRSLAELEAAIDEYVRGVMLVKEMPGLSLAVLNVDATDQLTKGYGVKRLDSPEIVTEDTLFYIASTTKAMTASVLLETMLRNNVSMSTPVKELFSDFQVAEYYRQEQATVGDLIAHRMGVPESLYNWLLGAVITSRLDIVKRALYFKPMLPFRDSNYYSNLFFCAAGLVTEVLSDYQTWETVMRDTLFTPLQMHETSFMDLLTPEQLASLATAYEPDFRNNNAMREVQHEFFKHVGLGAPGGDVVSNARDIVKWLYLLTHGGVNEAGDRVIDEQIIQDAMSPHAVTQAQTGTEPYTATSENYGYGWYTGFYKGYQRVNHGGYMFGYHALATVYPTLKIGIFTLVNGQQMGGDGQADIHNYITELLLNNTGSAQREGRHSTEFQQLQHRPDSAAAHFQYSSRAAVDMQSPQQPKDPFLDEFIGVYGNFAYGNITIFFNESTQRLQGDYGDLMQADMYHMGVDRFMGQPSEVCWFFPPIEMTFTRRLPDTVVVNVTVPILLEIDPPVFTRGLTMDQAPPAPTCDC